MSDIMDKLILRLSPGYDFNRYRYKAGDIVTALDGAILLVKESAIDYVTAYALKRSYMFRNRGENKVPYSALPDIPKGSYVHPGYKVNKTLKWKAGDIIIDETYEALTVYLYEEVHRQCFYGFVLAPENNYYLHSGIYIQNPYKDYITA